VRKGAGFILFCLAAGLLYGSHALNLPVPVWFYVGLAIGTVFHEAGHALCAVLAASPIRKVSIGAGLLLFKGRIRDMQFEWRLLPFGGFVACYPKFDVGRLRASFIV
jgi:hypothetical protein